MAGYLVTCFVLLSGYPSSDYKVHPKKFNTCIEVYAAAEENGLDPILLSSVAYVESGFSSTAVSSKGAVGPLQILPRYFCPKGKRAGCDYVQAGIDAFKAWNKRYPKIKETLCHYNSGNRCNPRSKSYARLVLRKSNRVKKVLGDIPWYENYRVESCYRCPECCAPQVTSHKDYMSWLGSLIK